MYVCMHACTYPRRSMCACMSMHENVCVYVCVSACVQACMADMCIAQSMKRCQVLEVELELPLHRQMISEHIKKIKLISCHFSKYIRIYMRYELIGKRSNISGKPAYKSFYHGTH